MAEKASIVSPADEREAQALNKKGLQQYQRWEIEEAIESFEKATRLVPTNPDYHLNLARALARFGNYDRALKALGEFVRYESDVRLVDRFEMLFANAMDEVETLITEKMTGRGIPLDEIGAAIQMWLEYRIALGRRPLSVRKPQSWAAALDYTVRKVNFRDTFLKELSEIYGVSESSIRNHHKNLVETLDIMPCDYRYFRGKNNPLDKLVEAAAMLEELERRFREP
ncbi:MAG TPA: tetratricopeptide repeat protein [Anaerolineae bacterium]|nr:tetratricopeptide repeat protein [Anaerolineae bacterium]